jgi:hypothetical protein
MVMFVLFRARHKVPKEMIRGARKEKPKNVVSFQKILPPIVDGDVLWDRTEARRTRTFDEQAEMTHSPSVVASCRPTKASCSVFDGQVQTLDSVVDYLTQTFGERNSTSCFPVESPARLH